MSQLSDKLFGMQQALTEMPLHDCTLYSLRHLAEHGYDNLVVEERRGRTLNVGKGRDLMGYMLMHAMQAVDSGSCLNYDDQKGHMRLEFSSQFEKPPVRQLRYQIDAFKKDLLDHCMQDDSGYYVVRNGETAGSFGYSAFMQIAAGARGGICPYYVMPKTEPFTDAEGTLYKAGDIVSIHVFNELAEKRPELNEALDGAMPVELWMDRLAMKTAMDALGITHDMQQSRAN